MGEGTWSSHLTSVCPRAQAGPVDRMQMSKVTTVSETTLSEKQKGRSPASFVHGSSFIFFPLLSVTQLKTSGSNWTNVLGQSPENTSVYVLEC